MDEQKIKENILLKSRRRSIWKRIVSSLACVVVFCTTYALILPAITMSKDVFCGHEEHTHGNGCYESVLICEFDTQNKSDSIEEEESSSNLNVVVNSHEHMEDCYIKQSELICVISETEGHAHNEACYEMREVLICEITDTEVDTTGNIDSGILVSDENVDDSTSHDEVTHEHTEVCYEKSLICTLEEHVHTKICHSDRTADVESAEDWEATIPDDGEMTGNWRKDLITVAKSQLGYEESTKNYEVTSNGDIKGYTRYGEWYGDTYGDWCAMFVSFCLEYAGINKKTMPQNSNCQNWIDLLKETEYELYRDVFSDYKPQSGDLIFFEWGDGDKKADHIGIIVDVEADGAGNVKKLKTIEGNSGDKVRYREYDTADSQILGYGELPENPLETQTVDEVRVQKVIDLIAALPTAEEIEDNLYEYDELGDMDGYEAYYKQVYNQALTAYVLYEDLSEELRAQVTNENKLMELEWLWSASVMANTYDIPVYQTNTFNNVYSAVIFCGKSADDYGITDIDFNWWTAIVVEAKDSGELYVDNIITTGGVDKSVYGPVSSQGFVLLVWHGRIPISHMTMKVGDLVNTTFDYTKTNTYSEDSYGIITFESPDGNNGSLTIVEGADTRDLITVNLYDYTDNINDPYNYDSDVYPGFQQDEGQLTATATYHSNFGNNITEDLDAGYDAVTQKDGTNINATIDLNGTGLANSPISGMMNLTLNEEGYPSLADNTSLRYLFSGGSGYATKRNKQSINGLFLYNDETGAYTFNSRENHAQFNSADDTFTLYEQLISSNFIWYPFGNFLPFNDITEQTTQASTINREYFQAVAVRAKNKYDQNGGEEYLTLADTLESWIALMDAKYNTDNGSWDGAKAMNEYFNNTGPGSKVSDLEFDFSKETELLNKIYSIDYDEATNFYFGMEMLMNFMQPKGGLTGKTGKEEMVFYFTGDDDVWVYVDGVLFLDLSGIHRHVGGEIDFVNGVVNYYSLDVATGDVSNTPYKQQTFAEILTAAGKNTDGLNEKGTFKDYSTHSFNFYYMERGAGSGVCRMNFNFPLLRQNSISVAKELTVDDEGALPILGNPDFKFQILKADVNATKTNELFIEAGVFYKIYDSDNVFIGTGTTDANGVFALKAGQRAEFSDIPENAGKYYVRELLEGNTIEQYGKISVDGNSITTNYDVNIGQDTFQGVESNVKDISDGVTLFNFNNQVATEKLASLEIKKVLGEGTQATENQLFEFYVTFDDKPIPLGTEYMIGDKVFAVEDEGIIVISSNETAIIPKILAGSVFTVSETAASSKGYTVIYAGSAGIQSDGEKAYGVVAAGTTVKIEVTNSENGANVRVTGEKNVSNPDSISRTVTFKLEQVTDFTGELKANDGLEMTTEIQVVDTAEFQFNLSYLERNLPKLPVTYYYKITETTKDDAENVFKLDKSFYVIEVTISKTDDILQAVVTNRWKNGTDVMNNTESVTFTNILLCDLKLEKIVSGRETEDKFVFEITLTDTDGNPMTGNYVAEKTDDGVTDVTFDAKGKVVVQLSHGESITIKGIPNGSEWNIVELSAGDYIVSHVIGTGDFVERDTASGEVTAGSNMVTYINTATYALPETGGIGTTSYILGGLLTAFTAGFLLLYKNTKRGKEDYNAS